MPALFTRSMNSVAPGRGTRPWPRLSPRANVPSRSSTKPRTFASRSRVLFLSALSSICGRAGTAAPFQHQFETRLLDEDARRVAALWRFAYRFRDLAHDRVVVPRGRAGGFHGIDLLRRHDRTQQELLVRKLGAEPASSLIKREARRLGSDFLCPWTIKALPLH